MSDFVQKALARQPAAPEWLLPFNALGRENSRGKSLPSIRVEDWKYTSLRALEEGSFVKEPEHVEPSPDLAARFQIPDLDAYRLVFVNGHYSATFSDAANLPKGMTLTTFANAEENAVEEVRAHLGEVSDGDRLFSALNASWLADGVFLHIARNTKVDKPVQLVWLSTPQSEAFGIAQRLLVVMEEGSEAAVLEQFVSTDEPQNVFTNGVSEFVIGDNAQLRHCRLHLEEPGAIHVGAVHASVGRNAVLSGFHVALGGRLKRNDIQVRMRGEGGHCELNGVYLPRNREVIDYHTCIEHEVPNCTSEETFRGIIADEARAVFNGRIHIHRDAQKTSAHLSNRNLLTSNKAEVDTKPELEIYADDVQCSHGATVAQLDEGHLYYLLSRGVSEQEAQVLLSFGFINEILNRIRREALQNYLRAELRGLFAQDDHLTRHLL